MFVRALRRSITVLLSVLVVAVATAPAAAAHSGPPGPTNLASHIDGIRPATTAVTVRLLDLSRQIELRMQGHHVIVVLGYNGEPYLRIDDGGAWENERSPAVYLDQGTNGVPIPPDADPAAPPRWRHISSDTVVRWHDHRTHWMSPLLPTVVREEPDRVHVLTAWELPVRIDDVATSVAGTITWTPGPNPAHWWAIAAVIGALLSVVALIGLRTRPTAAGVALASIQLSAAGAAAVTYAFVPDSSASIAGRLLTRVVLLAVPATGILIGLRWLVRGRPVDGWLFVGTAATFLTLIGGFARSAVFSRSHLDASGPPTATRLLVACTLGAGMALVVSSLRYGNTWRPHAQRLARHGGHHRQRSQPNDATGSLSEG